jgi:penicillin-binding protein 2
MFEGEHSKKEKINRRTFFLLLIQFFGFSLLLFRIFWLQFFESKKYQILSQKNRIRILPISPTRGIINDVNGNILANNKYCYKIIMDKQIIKNWQIELEKLFAILNSDQDIKDFIKNKISTHKGNSPIVIFDNITWQELSLVEENSCNLEGIYVDKSLTRKYNFIPYISHIIGYTGFVKNNSSETKDIKEGIRGVEKAFDSNLRGNFGYKEIEVNAHGKFIRDLKIIESTKGSTINLSIDAVLQEKIYKMLPRNNLIVIISDVRSGKIKSLISKPSFDNSIFTNYVSKSDWRKLVDDPESPLLNRALQSLYSPGSVFKIVTILASLEAGISEYHSHYCSGNPYLGNHFRCWNINGHGVLDMESAIARSCNHYIYSLAEKVGPGPIIGMAKKLRLDNLSGLEDLGGEVKSFIPDPEWKMKRFNQRWRAADTFNFCLGQGYLRVTPIILNQLISIIANEGNIVLPSIRADGLPKIIKTNIRKESFVFLKKALFNVVNKPFGTAYRNRVVSPKGQMSGKTGTVQVISKSSSKEDLNKAEYSVRNHAVFLGYYPSNEPKYAITVFVEHGGGGGSIAAEIAKNSFLLIDS